jgi:NAD-dependent dihydropyrimidine dehydrogenase PreA subunit
MIEVVSDERCTRCNLCIRACPMDVFDLVEDGPPVIARQDDCQTCFICEAHCPADALYVAPMRAPALAGSFHLDERRLIATRTMGSYRARLGWGAGRRPPRTAEEADRLVDAGPRADAAPAADAGGAIPRPA